MTSIRPLSWKRISQLCGIAAFLVIQFALRPPGLTDEARCVLAVTAWMAIWWVTDAVPIAVTALLPIVLFPLTGAVSLVATTQQYGHRFIFLYLGGFLLAIGIEKWGLHRRIALQIIHRIGASPNRIMLGFMIATAALSMWISNTATSVMMLPIGIALIAQLTSGESADDGGSRQRFGKALMLSIAYSASIGGVATLIGTPPNLVLAGMTQQTYGVEIGFAQWIVFGLPISVVLLAICWLYLTRIAFHIGDGDIVDSGSEIAAQLGGLGRMSVAEWRLLTVFSITAIAWISRSLLQQIPGLANLDDTIIAMTAGVSLFVIPPGTTKTTTCENGQNAMTDQVALLRWEDTRDLPWGIVLLFGGGMALAEGFQHTGLADWIGSQTMLLQRAPLWLLVLVLIAAVNFLTEITSNLATTSMLLPVLASMAESMHVHPFVMMIGATLAASCAFMLPVATPPNAVVFGYKDLHIKDMVQAGLWMNLISICVLSIAVYWVLPWLWGFEATEFPTHWSQE